MRAKAKSFFLYFVIALAVLGYVLIDAGTEHDNYSFVLTGVLIIGFVIIIWIIDHFKVRTNQNKVDKDYQKSIDNFKRNGTKVKVNLENVKIKTHSWKETHVSIDENTGLDRMMGYHESGKTKVDRILNTIQIEIPFNGQNIKYLIHAEMDTTTLEIHFAIKKETYLYTINNTHYLDLEFLNED